MSIAITVCFILAALLGAYLISFILRNKNTPKGVALVHGPLAVLGFILLFFYLVLYSGHPWVSFIIFFIAAMGGFMLMFRDITGKSLPKWFALTHGIVALCGFIVLIYSLFFVPV